VGLALLVSLGYELAAGHLTAGDIHRLDGNDNDGVARESFPQGSEFVR
jgi:hypothetical protein